MREQQAFRYPDRQQGQQPQGAAPEQRLPAGNDQRRTSRRYPPASTHRAGHYSGIHPEDAPYLTGELDDGEEDEALDTQRSHTSIRRYDLPDAVTQGSTRYEYRPQVVQTAIPPRRSAHPHPTAQRTDERPASTPRRQRRLYFHAHWSVFVGLGMLLMIAGWLSVDALASWWTTQQDDWTYSRPRTYQVDQEVGHNDSTAHPTHFIAENLNAEIVIIEIPGGDINKAVIYQGPTLYGPDASLAPITLSFQDVNHDGKIDMLIHFQGNEIIYLNERVNGTWKFVPQH